MSDAAGSANPAFDMFFDSGWTAVVLSNYTQDTLTRGQRCGHHRRACFNENAVMQPNILAAPELAPEGQRKIDWVRRNMPILRQLEQRFAAERPFAGRRITVCIHLEAKTAYLALVLRAGGADGLGRPAAIRESTKDDVVAALAAEGLHVYALHGAPPEEMRRHMGIALELAPHVVIDDGGDLVSCCTNRIVHTARKCSAPARRRRPACCARAHARPPVNCASPSCSSTRRAASTSSTTSTARANRCGTA